MDVYEAILKRRTIRKFKQEPIPNADLKKIINAARIAPSGGNKQAWHFIVITKKETLKQVFPLVKWAAYLSPYGAPAENERPTAYIVVSINEKDSLTPEADASAATMNMMLTATGMNIGTCWMASVNKEELAKIVTIPQNYSIKYVLALGYPAESPVIEDMKDTIKYYRDSTGTLRVPKKKVENIVSEI